MPREEAWQTTVVLQPSCVGEIPGELAEDNDSSGSVAQ